MARQSWPVRNDPGVMPWRAMTKGPRGELRPDRERVGGTRASLHQGWCGPRVRPDLGWQHDVVSGGGFGRSHFLRWRSDGERSRCVQNTTPRFAEGYWHECYGLRACTEESSACHHRRLSMGVIFQPRMEGMPRAHLFGFGLPEMQSRGHPRMVLTKVFQTAFGS
jgi:hypothetical protein